MKAFAQSEAYKNFLKRENSLGQRQERPFDLNEVEVHFRRINDAHKYLKSIFTEVCSKLSANAGR